jgi:hypothetical protein
MYFDFLHTYHQLIRQNKVTISVHIKGYLFILIYCYTCKLNK